MNDPCSRPVDKNAPWLTGLWYLAAPARHINAGSHSRYTLFDRKIVIGRTKNGRIFAFPDHCPHRGAPLSAGAQCEKNGHTALQCPYHGWQFSVEDGTCTHIPALSSADTATYEGVRISPFPVMEANGLIWIKPPGSPVSSPSSIQPDHKKSFENTLAIPAGLMPKSITIVDANGPYTEAVTGLVDPAHTPFVHQQWWWRKGQAAREKIKTYEPLPLGFRMPAHAPSGNSLIYKFLGGAPTTQIDFLLPGIRIETIKTGRHTLVGLTAITPLAGNQNRLTHCLFWDHPMMTLLTPMINAMSHSFLQQDGTILNQQADNITSRNHVPLYVGMPDEPAKWVRTMAIAWRDQMMPPPGSPSSTTDFVNPLLGKGPQTLHWKT